MEIISLAIVLISLFLGFFVFLKPDLVIELQRRFYEKINWKIEPVSMAKEVRNTKIMGIFLLIFCIAITFFYFFLK